MAKQQSTTADKVKALVKTLDEGIKDLMSSERYIAWLDMQSKFHHYSAGNLILIMLQKKDATRVAGYNTWKKLGRQVRKGETGIAILAPIPTRYETENNDGEIEVRQFLRFKTVYVFDVSQTDGEELPEIRKHISIEDGKVEDYPNIFKRLTELAPGTVSFGETGRADGFFSLATKEIVIKEGMSEAESLSVLIHELAHSLLHDNGERSVRNLEEVQAESVSYVVGKALGLEVAVPNNLGYLAGWSSNAELPELKASADLIQKTSALIIDKVLA